jgi:hypothetical protein
VSIRAHFLFHGLDIDGKLLVNEHLRAQNRHLKTRLMWPNSLEQVAVPKIRSPFSRGINGRIEWNAQPGA